MCISKPQKVIDFSDGKATVEFNGRPSRVKSPVPLKKGDYVLCQQGFVVRKVAEKEAKSMIKEWKEMNESLR